MDRKIIQKEHFDAFVYRWLETYTVIAPVESEGGISFAPIRDPHQAVLTYRNNRLSPKSMFFPQSEVMFRFDLKDGVAESTEAVTDPRVVLGIRPCDAKAMSLLDPIFDAPEYKDVYYLYKRRNTALIGLGCTAPCRSCFCTSLDNGPFDTRWTDVFLWDLGDRYLIDATTEKGAALLRDLTGMDLLPAPEEALRSAQAQEENAIRRIQPVEIQGIPEKLDGMFGSAFWDRLHEKCLGCGVCTFLCPTCHCFDIVDEEKNDRARRVRNWDGCQFALFTLETSGHNPRPTGKERMRQRIMHKFNYAPHNGGEPLCVGCGRCVTQCPVNLDIRRVLKEVIASGISR